MNSIKRKYNALEITLSYTDDVLTASNDLPWDVVSVGIGSHNENHEFYLLD